ncbi:MAG: hypothetical protein KGQ37_04550 [Hyphomicrobiales bacterium]|nr:hypothetical protein [Hyphomicrobiales bacterium]
MNDKDQKTAPVDAGGPKRQPPVIDAKAVPLATSQAPETKATGPATNTVRSAAIPPRPATATAPAQPLKAEPAKDAMAKTAPAAPAKPDNPDKPAKAHPHYAYAILLGALTALAGSVALHMVQGPQADVASLKAKVAALQSQLGKIADESAKSRLGLASDQASIARISADVAKLAGPKSATTLAEGTTDKAPLTGTTAAAQAPQAAPTAASAPSAASATALAALSASMATLQGKVATLDQSMPKVNAALAANQSAIAENKAKIAAAMATPQGAALAVVSQSIAAALQQGRAFPIEFKALQGMHVDAALLAPLAQIADKGPVSTATLATSFAPVLAAITRAQTPATPAPQGVMGWIGAKAATLVQVRDTRLPVGNAPGAGAAKVEDALRQGHDTLALQDWEALPPDARKLGADWVIPLQQRVAAEATVQKLSQEALAAMTSQMAHAP